MSFVDHVRAFCRAGSGGDGCLSFHREKFIEFGGPDGADGGKGGDIILEASHGLSTLLDVSHHPHLIAKGGANGKGSNKTGSASPDLVVYVPVGTMVYKNGALLADLSRQGQRVTAARGGRGGRGNLSFKSQRNTAPRIAEKGEPGEENEIELELKLIADVGLAGFPNAGKSSLLARVSNARPKVAAYPFTTLSPHLGLVKHKGADFVLADIPGLIEGAHAGKGLGDDFLRHVERTRIIVHLVDPLGFGKRGAVEGVKVIEEELKAFSKRLAAKPRVLVVNKMDLPEGPEVLKDLRARYRSRTIRAISCATGEGVSALLDHLVRELARRDAEEPAALLPDAVARVKVASGVQVERARAGVFRVRGEYVERVAAMTNLGQPEAVERLQHVMKKVGVDRALRRAGIKEGDTVIIGAVELDWSEAAAA